LYLSITRISKKKKKRFRNIRYSCNQSNHEWLMTY